MKSATAAAIAACSVVCMAFAKDTVKEIDAQAYPITEVCIEENPSVKIVEMISIIEDGFARHGIKANVYSSVPDSCEYFVKYTATQRWDFKPFLSDARIAVYREGLLIGFVERQGTRGVFGGGGMSPDKWSSPRTKLDPLMDRLLEGFRRRP